MGVKFTNNAFTTLSSGISAGATSFSVASVSTFPSLGVGDHMYVSITDEVVKVTAISGTTLTCVATSGAHSAGVPVELRMTAELLNDFAEDTEALPLAGGQMSGNITMAGSQTVDGRDLSADGTKLDGIEANATADQTAAQIKTHLENGIDSVHYVDGSIDAEHIASNAVTTAKIANDAVTEAKLNLISTGSVPSLEAKGTSGVTDGYIQLNCSENSHGIRLKSPPHSAGADYTLTFPDDDGAANEVLLTNGSGVLDWTTVGTSSLAATSVTTAKIASGAVTTTKIGADAVTGAKIADDAIDSEHIAADSIDAEHYAPGSVDTTALAADSVTTAKIADNVTLGGNVTVSGDLTVSGDTTTVNTATLAVEDPLVSLATGNNSADAVDIGIYGLYDTSGSQDLYGGLFRDASDSGKWKLFKDNQAAPTTTVNTSGTGYAVGTLVANLEGNVTGALTGNAATATKLATARSFTTTGDVVITSTNFDGSANFTAAATIQTGAVEHAMLAGDAVDGDNIADDSIDSEHYVDGSIDTAHIANNSITGAKIPDGAISTSGKIANDIIDSQHYANGSIDTAHIGDDQVTAAKLANSINTDIATGVTANTTANAALPKAGGTMTGDLAYGDNVLAKFGASNDLQIYHDGSDSYITEVGTGDLKIQGQTNISLLDGESHHYVKCVNDGAVELYHDNNKKIETTSAGVQVTGQCYASAGKFGLDDNDHIDIETTTIQFKLNGNEEMRLEADGDLHVDGDVIAFSSTVSDATLKYDINPIDHALDKVAQLTGVTYKYLKDGMESAGLLAQDVEKVMPCAVSERELPLHKNDGKSYKTLNYDNLHALLIESIKELTAKVEKLEKK
jgi:hypothetical protein